MAVPNMIVTLVASTTRFTQGMNNASSRLTRFGSVARRIGGVVAGATMAMLAGFARFSVEAIKDASNLEQSLGGVESVYKEFAGQMVAQSEMAATKVGLSMEQYQRVGVLTGTLLKNAGIPMKELATQTDILVTLAADLAATFGGTVEEAANAMNAALRGEFEPIRRFGIALSQAQIIEKALTMTQKESATELTKREKVLATQALLLKQGADASGQFARESDTLANRQQVLAAKFENLSANLGEKFLPIAEVLAEALINIVDSPGFQKALNDMVQGFEDFGKWLVSAEGQGAVKSFGEAFLFVIDTVANTVKGIQALIAEWNKFWGIQQDKPLVDIGRQGGTDNLGRTTPTRPTGPPLRIGTNAPVTVNFNAPVDSVSAGREVARVLADYSRANGVR
jgi:hypothetical protein